MEPSQSQDSEAEPEYDLSYLQQMTPCLAQCLAQVVLIKPADPIEYLAYCLKQYRMVHPLTSASSSQSLQDETEEPLCSNTSLRSCDPDLMSEQVETLISTGYGKTTSYLTGNPDQSVTNYTDSNYIIRLPHTSSEDPTHMQYTITSPVHKSPFESRTTSTRSTCESSVPLLMDASIVPEEDTFDEINSYLQGDFVHLGQTQDSLLVGDLFDDDDLS